MVDLKRVVRADFNSESTYSFSGRQFPECCCGTTAQCLFADMVTHDAFSGPNEYLYLGDQSHRQAEVLNACLEAGYIEHGWNFLRRHRQTAHHRHVFKRRSLVLIRD